MIKAGQFTERLFSRVLADLGYANTACAYNKANLLQFLRVQNPNRLDWLETTYPECPVEKVVDYAFGIDYLVKLPPTGQLVGLDFTINALGVDSKLRKISRDEHLWKHLGVSRMLVVCFELPPGEDQGLAFYDTESAADDLLDSIFSAIESSENVNYVTIKVRRK
jgi:hypothetical protein